MGISTDAILCYGFRLKDEDGEEGNITLDWLNQGTDVNDDDVNEDVLEFFKEFLAQLYGLKKPDDVCNEIKYNTQGSYKQKWNDYWYLKEEIVDQIGVSLVGHCSDKCTMYILAATASEKTASRGYPIELGQSIEAKKEWREKIRLFCEKANIPFEEPQWILCSFWGE